MACNCMGTFFCSTVLTTTGTAGGAVACTFFSPQAVQASNALMASAAAPRNFARTLFALQFRTAMLFPAPVPIFGLRKRHHGLRMLNRCGFRLHAAQPDIGQGAAHLAVVELLVLFPAK